MRIAIVGAGGVGGYLGGRLVQAGQDVTFIARGAHLKALQTQGLKVESIHGDFTLPTVQATDNPAIVGTVDLVFVGVKSWQVPEAAEAMRPMVGPETFVVPIQNGVEAPRQLSTVLGAKHVVGGLCRITSFIAGPGHVRHTGADPSICFGELDNRVSDRVNQLNALLEKTEGVQGEIASDIQVALWTKFLLIVSWSGVGAVTRAPLGIIRQQPETRTMLKQVMEEVVQVANAHDIKLPYEIIDKTLGFMDSLPETSTTSMQRDIMDGRPSELEAQNGAVVRLGKEKSVNTPINSYIYASLLPLESRANGLIQFDTE